MQEFTCKVIATINTVYYYSLKLNFLNLEIKYK